MNIATQDLPGGQGRFDDPQTPTAAGRTSPPAGPRDPALPNVEAARLADVLLLIYADALDDLERVRIATENRARALRQAKGMADTREEARLLAMVDGLAALEHSAELDLGRTLRQHPLGGWVRSTVGVGEKQGARLLAAVGDPYLRPDGTPRTVSQLWAYCGYHVLRLGQGGSAPQAGFAEADLLGSGPVSHGVHPKFAGADLSHPDHLRRDAHLISVGVGSVRRRQDAIADTQASLAPPDPSASGHALYGAHRAFAAGSDLSDLGHIDGADQPRPAGVAPSRKRGQKANWHATAKMRAFLVAEAAVKAGVRKLDAADDSDGYDAANRKAISPLGEVYLNGRIKYADAVHPVPCSRCGPAGRPAVEGSPLSEGHKHARALRLVAKEVLRQLWVESKRLHELDEVAS